MSTCEHKTGKVLQSGKGWKMWQCTWDCQRITIETDDGKEQTLTEFVAERDGLARIGESLIDDRQRRQEQIEQDERLIESLRQERDDLYADLTTAVNHLRAILASTGDATNELVNAERWIDGYLAREVTQ